VWAQVVAALERLKATDAIGRMDEAEADALERLNNKSGCGCLG